MDRRMTKVMEDVAAADATTAADDEEEEDIEDFINFRIKRI